MKTLPLKIIFIFALTYGSTSGLSIGKSVKLDLEKVASANVSVEQAENHVQDADQSPAEVKAQPKLGDVPGEKRNLQLLEEGRGKKKKKIKGVLFLMMVAMAVKCIMVLKALTIKALLASKIALVLSLLSIIKKLFEKPDQKPQTNIVLKREPEHHYSRSDYVGRIEDGDNWMAYPDDRLVGGQIKRMRVPVAKGVFENWTGRYNSPRGILPGGAGELYYETRPKRKKKPPCNCGKGYLLGSLERGRGDLEEQASEHENRFADNQLSKSRKLIHDKKPKNPKSYLEGNNYPYAITVGKRPNNNLNTDMRDWNLFDNKQTIHESNNGRESNINKGMIQHYDNDVFKGVNWVGVAQPNGDTTNVNNGFENGRSTQVFANWDAYKEFFGHLRSTADDIPVPSVRNREEITNRHHFSNHRGDM